MKRREFITLLGGSVLSPLPARAQQPERMRRVGVLMGWSENDSGYRSWIAVFVQQLAQLGWVDGRNVRIDIRWTGGDIGQAQILAKELGRVLN